MKRLFFISLILIFSTGLPAQSDGPVMDNVKKSLNIGSARELVKNFDSMIEMSIEGNNSSYNKAQSEVVLKEFFKKNPASSFKYIHHGGSGQGGLKYAIGKYMSGSTSYRVLIRFKEINGSLAVFNMSFTKE